MSIPSACFKPFLCESQYLSLLSIYVDVLIYSSNPCYLKSLIDVSSMVLGANEQFKAAIYKFHQELWQIKLTIHRYYA